MNMQQTGQSICRFAVSATLAFSIAACAAPGGRPTGPVRAPEQAEAPRAPMPPPGFLEHCLVLIQGGQYDEARRLLGPVVDDHPNWARAHYFLALTYHKQNRYEHARTLFERSLQLEPEQLSVRLYHGWCLYYLGQLDASRAMFESYLAVKPDYPDAVFALGLIDFDDDAIESAEHRFTRTVELARKEQDWKVEAKAIARLADVFVRKGELERARDALARSIELNPDNYEPYYKLSRVLERLGDAEGAEQARQSHRTVRRRVRPGVESQGRP